SSSFLYTSSLSTFFFKSPATTEIYTLSLHDALPISWHRKEPGISDGGAGKPVTDQIQASPADRRGFRARNGDALRRRHVLSHGHGRGGGRQSKRCLHHGKDHRIGSTRNRRPLGLCPGFRRKQQPGQSHH